MSTAVSVTQHAAAAPLGAEGGGASGSGTVPVIVFLKKQPAPAGGTTARSMAGDRAAVIQAAQAPYLSQLQQVDASDVHSYQLVNAIAARVPASEVASLAGSPGVSAVIPDSPIAGPDPAVAAEPAGPAPKPAAAQLPTPPGACSAGAAQLAPEGLGLTHTDSTAKGTQTARSLGYTGAGVKVGFLADGIDTSNVNLMRGGHSVITDYQDFSGDGTAAATSGGEAFLDANAIAGQGTHVYNVAGFSAQVPKSACNIKIEGVAPGASLVALKVFSKSNVSTTSGFLQAIDYAVNNAHVNVLNESFGASPFPDVTSLDAVKQFNDMAVRAGVTVVVAAGDAGPYNTIGSPASDPNVISVGASTAFQFYAQTGYAGAGTFAAKGWQSNNISSLSSGGFTQDGRTLDLVAPGDLSWSSCTADPARYSDCVNFTGHPSDVAQSGGTSESAPEVAAAAALVIQSYRKAHGGSTPAPAAVKRMLLSTAADLGAPATEQGAGLLDTRKAVELASWMEHCDPVGSTLQLSANQLNYVGAPGATASWSVTVTNTGQAAQRVSVTGRGQSAPSTVKKATVTLSDSASQHFTSWTGTTANYGTVKFTVPSGQAQLGGSIAWPTKTTAAAGSVSARVRLVLIDPSGKLAAHSLPQGVSGYGSAQVLHPAAGTWTAVIFSDSSASGGTVGAVQFGATTARSVAFGKVTPSTLNLKPGASAQVHVSAVLPGGAGDTSGAVVLSSAAGGGTVTVPVTLRGVLSAALGQGVTFSGTLTGGNGRAPGQGQVAAYTFTVPGNLPLLLRDIDADVTLANDPENQVSGYLIAPGGQTMGYGSNYLTTGFTSAGVPVEAPQRQLSVYTSNPIPGTWTLLIDFTSPVPGNELSDAFTGRIRLNSVSFNRGGLPDAASVKLKAGKAYNYTITVRNTGAAPEDIFLDPRLDKLTTYQLQPQNQVSRVKLPLAPGANPPEWIVPTMTHSVTATAASSSPVMFDVGPFPGDPDLSSAAGKSVSAGFPVGRAVTPVTQGLWFAVPSQVGPYGVDGAGAATVTMSMSATTQAFDTTASSGPGDFWKFAVAPLASTASFNLFQVNPGQTRTITLTLKPAGKAGTVVKGLLYIDNFSDSLQFLSGSQMVMLPYQYTIG